MSNLDNNQLIKLRIIAKLIIIIGLILIIFLSLTLAITDSHLFLDLFHSFKLSFDMFITKHNILTFIIF